MWAAELEAESLAVVSQGCQIISRKSVWPSSCNRGSGRFNKYSGLNFTIAPRLSGALLSKAELEVIRDLRCLLTSHPHYLWSLSHPLCLSPALWINGLYVVINHSEHLVFPWLLWNKTSRFSSSAELALKSESCKFSTPTFQRSERTLKKHPIFELYVHSNPLFLAKCDYWKSVYHMTINVIKNQRPKLFSNEVFGGGTCL